jgi:DNA-binding response OmpR family regulator
MITNRVRMISSSIEFTREVHLIRSYDIIITDLQFPWDRWEPWWYTAIEMIREYDSYIPIIVLSGRSEIDVLRRAFDLGATDYIIKPIRPKELELRIMNSLRQSQWLALTSNTRIYEIHGLIYFFDTNEFYISDHRLILTRMNKYLLFLFVTNTDRILSESYLKDKIWWDRIDIVERNIRITILRLRNALAPYGIAHWIRNTRGEGYICDPR